MLTASWPCNSTATSPTSFPPSCSSSRKTTRTAVGPASPARYRPSLEWANVKYAVTDEFSVRVGRMVLPFNMLSEYRNVGYSLPFVRAPVELYGSLPFTNFDGGELSYSRHFGDVTNSVVGGVGSTTIRGSAVAAQARLSLLTDTVEVGALTVHAMASLGEFTTPLGFGTLFDDFAQAAGTVPGGEGAASTAEYLDGRYNTLHWSACSNLRRGSFV